ncbi:cholinesterase 1-like [Thrips palmi]|uniref:Carboxylic ester hydrolase n=1 Tax=Thrips palmi TaxID=161013 RepID=A0A6P9A291_THRPL|nr:cholinesterase 1-like [Thrips palmi]
MRPGGHTETAETQIFPIGVSTCVSQTRPKSAAMLVWLHGGGFLIGDGSPREYGPELLLDRGVIVVTLNYRLGVLGFLYGGPGSGAPGNAGLRDQALALLWVRDNVAGFGGDPGRVTVWGESAGAIGAHMHSMAAAAPFQRLILSSGVAILPWAVQDRPLDALQRLADTVGWPSTRSPDHPRDLVQFLRKVPTEHLVAAGGAFETMTVGTAQAAGRAREGLIKFASWLPRILASTSIQLHRMPAP